MKNSRQAKIVSVALVLLGSFGFACGHSGPVDHEVHTAIHQEGVSLEIVASDLLGFAVEGVEVQIVGAWHERDDLIFHAPTPVYRGFTNSEGFVVFEPVELAEAHVGFLEDEFARAILQHLLSDNGSVVFLRIGADSLGWIEVDVPISHARAHAEVFIEFDIS